MSRVDNVMELIGRTPLVKLNRLTQGIEANVYVKIEAANPGGSVKDRLAFAMIEAGEKQGHITSETTIIEPTSGNTGIGLAMICAVKGYKLIIVMPESVSTERRTILKAYGAQLYLTPAAGGMKAAIQKANELKEELANAFIPMQFENEANDAFHRKTTATANLGRYSRRSRYIRGRGRYRWNYNWSGRAFERIETKRKSHCC